MKLHALASLLILVSTLTPLRAAEASALPAPWKHQDIGAVEVPGTATAKGEVFTLQGTLDIWGKSDGFHFAWQKLKGDGSIVARVLSVDLSGHSKGGVAIRETLDAGSRHATMCDTPTDGCQFLVRAETGGVTTAQRTDLNKALMPYWVKLVREGDRLSGFESVDGKTWTPTGSSELHLPEAVFIGLITSSHHKDKLCTASFDHVSVMPSAK